MPKDESDEGEHTTVDARTATDKAPADRFPQGLTLVSGGLTLLIAVFAGVSGLTGGVARMFRNADPVAASAPFALVLLSFVICIVALAITVIGLEKISYLLLVLAAILFSIGTYLAIDLMVNTASLDDRPALVGKYSVVDTEGGWSIEGKASATGLGATDRMQVLVYGADQEGKATRLYFGTAGPNADGVAEQTFHVPLPHQDFASYVVTANLGNLPRLCNGDEVVVPQQDPAADQPPDASGKVDPKDVVNSCLTLLPPPPLPPAR